jgi:peptide-methionine (R)-S-oxide reductase
MQGRIRLSDNEWRRVLTSEQFRITRQQGTEPPCSGRYHDFHGIGVYRCICCGNELFSSRDKSLIPEKWPNFRAPIRQDSITMAPHIVEYLVRTAVKCGRCDAHLGYMFPERRSPSWTRYLINSTALFFHDDRSTATSSAGALATILTGGHVRSVFRSEPREAVPSIRQSS